MPFSGPDKRQKVLVLLTMCFALFMAMLDNTVVNVALPTISRTLGAGVSGLQWVVDGYVLAFASLLLTGGILGDRYGRKRLFILGLIGFTGASLLCGLSHSTGQLVAFRALQGIGASLLMPGTLSIITATFPVEERAQAIGIWAGVSGIALALGPTAGGWLVEHAGWASVFFLNVPIGVVGVVVASRVVKESFAPNARKLDAVGLVLGTGMLFSITYALIEANQFGWGDKVILSCIALACWLLVGFIWWEARNPDAMVPTGLFRMPAFATGTAVAFTISVAMFGTFFFFSLYLQLVRGYTAFQAGVRFLPLTAMIVFTAPNAGRLAQKYGSRWPLTFGLTLAGSGLLLLSRIGTHTNYLLVTPILMMMGIGMGSTMTPMTAAVMNAVGPQRAGLGSAATNTAREVGGVFGVALLGTLLTGGLRDSLRTALTRITLAPGTRSSIVATAGHGQLNPAQLKALPPDQATYVQHAFGQAFMHGFRISLTVAGLLALVIAAVANRNIGRGQVVASDDHAPSPLSADDAALVAVAH
jgi:EmrB/QacA subfamily drug resistance transporter